MSNLLDWCTASLVSWLCDVIAISVHAANCAIRLFKLLFHVNANVCL